MRKQTVLDHFKTRTAIARALGITKSAVSQWKEELIPEHHAYRLQRITRRKLKVDPSMYEGQGNSDSAVA